MKVCFAVSIMCGFGNKIGKKYTFCYKLKGICIMYSGNVHLMNRGNAKVIIIVRYDHPLMCACVCVLILILYLSILTLQ